MKKFVIIASIILTTGVTAFALTRKENKPDEVKLKIETTTDKTSNIALATAD
ncbi:hypothetical protein [Mucilaginibacter sp. UR6-11]|uniref:hypothetical protein n=1 Tax=Mucilaginibacter sp. UR6-11 TaxID=1435644 RepID=UPI001E4654CB|nr:hypothetical protein [Mucilaginibacter sp. UR6-11]MCC8426645.1 hypothetical protein [Mucilaginibacter sp. UR6-11]